MEQILTDKTLIERINEAIEAIKADFQTEVIKDYELPPLVNTKTGENIGVGVMLQLSTRYDYDDRLLGEWQRCLGADEYYITVRRNRLWVTFKVRDFVPSQEHIDRMTHAIGLDQKEPINKTYEPYRNGVVYDEPHPLWDELVIAGYAADRRKPHEYYYHVTPKGFQLLADHYRLMIRHTEEYDGISKRKEN